MVGSRVSAGILLDSLTPQARMESVDIRSWNRFAVAAELPVEAEVSSSAGLLAGLL